MYFITGLPKVHEKDCIYVAMDQLTMFAHFFVIPMGFQVAQVAELFF